MTPPGPDVQQIATPPYGSAPPDISDRLPRWLVTLIVVVASCVVLGAVAVVVVDMTAGQRLSALKQSIAAELQRASDQRDELMPQPQVIADIGLPELSRLSWITCDVTNNSAQLFSNAPSVQVCRISRDIYLDPGAGVTAVKQLTWVNGRTHPFGCTDEIYQMGVYERLTFYPSLCVREAAAPGAMAPQGESPAISRPVVSVRSEYWFMIKLGCKPFSILCEAPFWDPVRI